MAAAVLVAAVSSASAEQLILSDNFDVTGGNSPGTTFTNSGVNYEVGTRISGSAVTANPALRLLRTNTGKGGGAYSISNNQLVVGDAAGIGSFQYSADGTTAYNFGSFLAGQTYEIKLTLTLGETEDVSRRASFHLTDVLSPTPSVNDSAIGFQVASNAASGGPQSAIQRIRGISSSTGSAINASVLEGLAYNEPVDFRLVVTDSTNYTEGVFESIYSLYVNDTLAATGNFRFTNDSRYLVFDVAPNSGPASYDNFSVAVIPEPSTLALSLAGVLGGIAMRRRFFVGERSSHSGTAARGDAGVGNGGPAGRSNGANDEGDRRAEA